MNTPNDPYEGLKNIIGNLGWQDNSKQPNTTPDTSQDTPIVPEDISQTKITSQNTAANLTKTISCPYPNHAWYTKLRNKLSPTQQEFLKRNVRGTDSDKIEIIKMKRNYSLMTANPTITEGVYDGSHTDRANNSWIAWVTYFDPTRAMRTVWHHGHAWTSYIMESKHEIDELLGCLPGNNEDEKLLALSILLDIPKTWSFIHNHEWIHVWVTGYVRISRVFSGHPEYSFRMFFNDDHAGMDFTRDVYACPTLVYEHVGNNQENNTLTKIS